MPSSPWPTGKPTPSVKSAPHASLVVATGIATMTKSMISPTITPWIFSTVW
jgi:hypothetical protein